MWHAPVLLWIALSPAMPDLLLPGERAVTHELVLEDGPLFARYRLIVSPVRGFGSLTVIEPGEPFRFSTKYGSKIYAIAPEARLPEVPPRGAEGRAQWPRETREAEIPVHEVRAVPVLSRVHRIVTTLRIEAAGDGELRLAVLGERRWDGRGRRITGSATPLLLGVALLGCIGVVLVWRRRIERERTRA